MFKVGDAVWWLSVVGGKSIERAGYVVTVVPAGESPLEYVPPDLICKVRPEVFRTHDSYVIQVPGVPYYFWPQVAALAPMTNDKQYVFAKQPKRTKHYFLKASSVDKSDRHKLIDLAEKILGVDYTETSAFLEVPAWGKRFWFKISSGEEYISRVDQW